MSTSKVLQKPQIISIIGGTIRIAHPDLSAYAKTFQTSPLSAAGTTLTVADNNRFNDDDWFILGEVADGKTEECDVNGAVTRGTSLTITNTTKFSHEIHTPVRRIQERAIKIYGAATDGGAGTLIASVDAITTPIADAVMIQWDKLYTEWTLISTDTTYAYYYVTFVDGTTASAASDYTASTGLTNLSVQELVDDALNEVNSTIDNDRITEKWLLKVANDWQDEITSYVTQDGIAKDWSFEAILNETSLTLTENENKYALSSLTKEVKYSDTNRGIINLKMGSKKLGFVDIDYFDEYMEDKVRNQLNGAVLVGATSIILDSVAEFSSSGTIYVGSDTVTYTTRTLSTNTLSGIPASGSGSITVAQSDDAAVWQGIAPQEPENYTIFDGNIYLDVPVDADFVGYKLKLRYLKKLTRFTSFSSTTEIPFTYTAKYYIGSKIEGKKGNTEESSRLYNLFLSKVEIEARKDGLPTLESSDYYDFRNDNLQLAERDGTD